jgi:multidrug resistance efflux pump
MINSNAALNTGEQPLWTRLPGSVTDKDFCALWLTLQCELITGVKAGLVLMSEQAEGPYQVKAYWPNVKETISQLNSSAEQALVERSALIIQRKARGDSSGASLELYDIAYPIVVASRIYGVVVLKVTPRAPAALESVLQQLSWGAAWLEVMLHRQSAIAHVEINERLHTVLDVLATLMEHEEFARAANALVTDLSSRLSCDRVSLGIREGGHISLKAISHNARFAKRTKLTRAIENAMEEASDQETVIHYPSSRASDQITLRHERLAREHSGTAVCSIPLGGEGEISGVLTFERLADHPFDSDTVSTCETIASLAGPILKLKMRDDLPLTARLAEIIRARAAILIGSDHIAVKLATVIATLALLVVIFANGQYRVAAKTVIEAQSQRVAVAPFNGYITAARVRPGDTVRVGEILATFDDRELKLEQLKWGSQKEQYTKQYNIALAQHNASQVRISAAQVAQADAELSLVEDQLARTDVRAPIDGIIVSGDLSQSIGAPAERGQVLFEVAPLNAYRVVLQVDEREAAELAVGQRGKIALSAIPTDPLAFTVQKITPVSAAREGHNYFRVEAAMDKAPSQLRPGMEGVGKIDIAQRSLIWIWTHRAIDWLRLFVWSWIP